MKKVILVSALTLTTILISCKARLVDFTVISSKNVNLVIKKSEGKKVKASSLGFWGIGATIKDAMDKALEQAGPDYDLLVDGVVRTVYYPFIRGFQVEGIAISSSVKKAELGEIEYKKWCQAHQVLEQPK